MKTVSLSCQNCGAALEAPENIQFLTCNYCSSRLRVVRTSSAVMTELLESLDRKTTAITNDVEILKLQGELERLDREWMLDREKYMIRGRHGRMHEPGSASAIAFGLIAVVFGIFWISAARQSGAPGSFLIFGFAPPVIAGIFIFQNVTKSAKLESARSEYDRKRAQIIAKLEGAGGRDASQ